MTDSELDSLRSILNKLAPQGRTALLPALHAAQQLYGWLSEPIAVEVGRALNVPLADIYGVIDFYAMFNLQPTGRSIVRVCTAPVCAVAGADAVAESVCRHLRIEPEEVSSDGAFTVEHAPCLGLCDCAPALLVGETAIGPAEPKQAVEICALGGKKATNIIGGDIRILTVNCGKGHPIFLTEFQALGGYAGLKKALTMTPQTVLAEVKAAGLVGRGGAAFPTGIKWEGAVNAPGRPKYIV